METTESYCTNCIPIPWKWNHPFLYRLVYDLPFLCKSGDLSSSNREAPFSRYPWLQRASQLGSTHHITQDSSHDSRIITFQLRESPKTKPAFASVAGLGGVDLSYNWGQTAGLCWLGKPRPLSQQHLEDPVVVFFGEGRETTGNAKMVPSISINFPWSLASFGGWDDAVFETQKVLLSSCFIYPWNSSINRKHMVSLLGPTSVCEFQKVSGPQFPFRQDNSWITQLHFHCFPPYHPFAKTTPFHYAQKKQQQWNLQRRCFTPICPSP